MVTTTMTIIMSTTIVMIMTTTMAMIITTMIILAMTIVIMTTTTMIMIMITKTMMVMTTACYSLSLPAWRYRCTLCPRSWDCRPACVTPTDVWPTGLSWTLKGQWLARDVCVCIYI